MPKNTAFRPPFLLTQGQLPLLISIPHLGTHIPQALAAQMTPEAALASYIRSQGGEVAGSVVLVPISCVVAPPGLIASSMPG